MKNPKAKRVNVGRVEAQSIEIDALETSPQAPEQHRRKRCSKKRCGLVVCCLLFTFVAYIGIVFLVGYLSLRGNGVCLDADELGITLDQAIPSSPRYDLYPSLAMNASNLYQEDSGVAFDVNATTTRLQNAHRRFYGLHNTYTQSPRMLFPGWNFLIADWKYHHDPLSELLDQGMRFVKLDMHPFKDRVMVYHVQLMDDRSSCFCLDECLSQLADYLADPDAPGVIVSSNSRLLGTKISKFLMIYRISIWKALRN